MLHQTFSDVTSTKSITVPRDGRGGICVTLSGGVTHCQRTKRNFMPRGLVRSGDFRSGTPIILPHQFGNPVGSPEPFGNPQPQSNPRMAGNPVDWVPSPAHFGNQVDFSLQVVPPVIVVPQGASSTTNINLTELGGTLPATLSYFGAPVGVTVVFGANPDSTTSVATITVSSSVMPGRYTITVVGTTTPSVMFTQIQLAVQGS
jgi:hypothetical protein